MRHLDVLFIHLIAILTQLLQPGGVRSLIAESLRLKHQLLIVNRSRQRSPTLSSWDRILAGWMALLVRPTRLLRSAIVVKPASPSGCFRCPPRKLRLLNRRSACRCRCRGLATAGAFRDSSYWTTNFPNRCRPAVYEESRYEGSGPAAAHRGKD